MKKNYLCRRNTINNVIMGVRFNKRITIFPWLKANVSKSGVSLTVGPKGKTLSIGSSGVNVNVSMGKGVSYNKRLITWKKLNLLSWLGIGGAAASKVAKGSKTTKKGKKGTTKATEELSLDDALAEAEAGNGVQPTTEQNPTIAGQLQERLTALESRAKGAGCSWGCAIFGCLGTLVVLALVAVIVYLLVRDGSIDLSSLKPGA